jgi:hypothetical protein
MHQKRRRAIGSGTPGFRKMRRIGAEASASSIDSVPDELHETLSRGVRTNVIANHSYELFWRHKQPDNGRVHIVFGEPKEML